MIGRFCSIDPLAEKDRKWSTYSYGHNNPISHIDVDGMFDMVRLNDGTTLNDKSVNSQAEVSKKYGAGAKDVSGQTWTTGRDGVSVHFTKDSWEYVNPIKDIPYEGTTMALQDGIRANLPMLEVASGTATASAFAMTGGIGSLASSSMSLLGGAEGMLQRGMTSFASQFLGAGDDGLKGVDFADVAADTFLGNGAAAIFDGAVDFRAFDDRSLHVVGVDKSIFKATIEAGGYYLNSKASDGIGSINTSNKYNGLAHTLQIETGGLANTIINHITGAGGLK